MILSPSHLPPVFCPTLSQSWPGLIFGNGYSHKVFACCADGKGFWQVWPTLLTFSLPQSCAAPIPSNTHTLQRMF